MYIGFRVKYPLFLSHCNETSGLFGQGLGKYRNIKFQEIPSSGSRGVPRGQNDRQTDMTNLIVAFRNFPSAPKRYKKCKKYQWMYQ